MKTSMSLTTIFGMIFGFTLLFSAFLSLAIIYNKAYKLKNETISILEKYEGISGNSLKIINNYLSSNNYKTKATCKVDEEYGMADLTADPAKLEKAQKDKQYYYCVSASCTKENCAIKDDNRIYYNIRLFYKFDLPFIGDLMVFPIKGETKSIKLYSKTQKLEG